MQEYFAAHPEDLAALKRVRHRTAKYEVADKAHLQHMPAYIRKGLRQRPQGPRRTALPQPQQPSKDGELRLATVRVLALPLGCSHLLQRGCAVQPAACSGL